MRFLLALTVLALLPSSWCQGTASSKRGLVYVPSSKYPSDDSIWVSGSSDLTWYYNYGSKPSPAFSSSKLQFVPMLWGAPPDPSNTTFLNDVQGQIDSGAKIPYVLGFNEPDGAGNGGSNVPTDIAAQTWIREMEPLRKSGVKLGAPAMTGAPSGFKWLENFFSACNGGCTVDFIPVHWYGNFEGLASHVGQVRAAYPNITMWVTEYADPQASYSETQSFYNQSSQFFDRIDYITHYSYFGAFRSDVSNVGPNAAFLNQDGKLTNIGSWYLGGSATGIRAKGAAGRNGTFAGSTLLVVLVGIWCLS